MKKIILSISILTSLTMAGTFAEKKAECTGVLKTALSCMEKSTKPNEMKACKMEMKADMMKIKAKMIRSGEMNTMMKGMGKMKGMSNSKCAAGKCGGAK